MDLRELIETRLQPLLENMASESLNHSARLHFEKSNQQQLLAICFYGSIIEITYACIALLSENQITALPILLRSFLEAYADLRADINDPEYYLNLNATFIKEKLRIVQYAIESPQNPFMIGLVQGIDDIKAEKSKLETELANHKSKGRGPLNNKERLAKGELTNEYESVYWQLCLHGHNNLLALDDRHIEKHDNDFSVSLFKEPDQQDLLRYLDLLIAALIDSTNRIHKYLGAEMKPCWKQFQDEFDAARKNYG